MPTTQIIEGVLKIIGAVVLAGGGIGAIAYYALRIFGEKWLESKFAERMADLKHKHQKELEEVRFKINSMFDRTTKLHQREFEILPEAWAHLNDAYGHARSLTSPLQIFPDLARMSAPHLNDFLKECPLADWQKDEIRAASDKNKAYQEAIFWYRLYECRNHARDCHIFLRKNGIFLPKGMRRKFSDIEDLIGDALTEADMHKAYPDTRKLTGTKEEKLRKDGEKLMAELESEVQSRLWDSKPAEAV